MALASPAAAERKLPSGLLTVLPATPPLPTLDYVLASPAAGVSRPVAGVVRLAGELLTERPDMAAFYAESVAAAKEGRAQR
jgi:hypothetical protein